MNKTKVYLIGAGPGDPELITRKACRVLEMTDVVCMIIWFIPTSY